MLEIKNIYKTYTSKNGVSLRALENVSLKFGSKGIVFILGKSGSGKSTLLNMIGGLDSFDRGEIYFKNKEFSKFKKEDFDYYHNKCLGFVFQDFCLLDNLTAYQNIALSLSLQGKKDERKVNEALDKVGILSLKNRKVNELTGGQKQRIAIARAIVKNPQLILADEPTGALDSENSIAVMNLLKEISNNHLVIVVTHNKELAYEYGDRIIEIRDGFVLKDIESIKNVQEYSSRTMMYSSNLLFVPKGKKVTDDDLHEINTVMSEKRQDYYFLVEQDKRRVASLYPNLKEVFSFSKNDEQFVPYNHKEEPINEDTKKDKVGLPIKDSIDFSFSLMKKRKGRLFLSILITIFVVVIMGALSNFSSYSFSKAISTSLNYGNTHYLDVSSSFTNSDPEYKIQKGDIDKIESNNLNYAARYDKSLKLLNVNTRDELIPGATLKGFIAIDNVDDLGLNFLCKKENITNDDLKNGVYISSIVAEVYNTYNSSYSSYESMLGNLISISGGIKYQVLGVYDANYQKYSPLYQNENESLQNEYNKYANNLYLRLIVTKNFMSDYIDNKGSFTYANENVDVTMNIVDGTDINVRSNTNIVDVTTYNVTSKTEEIIFFGENGEFNSNNWENTFNERKYTLKENEIFVARDLLPTVVGQLRYSDVTAADIKRYNDGNHYMKITSAVEDDSTTLSETYYVKNVKIVGVILPVNTRRDRSIYLAKDEFIKLSQNYFCPSSLMITMNGNSNINKVIDLLYDNGFVINNDFVDDIMVLSTTITRFSSLIKIVLVSWVIIGTILFYSFMSKSIKDSRRHIGILKALGAKETDIFKIFTVEAILISIISIIISLFAYYYAGLAVNQLISQSLYSFYYPVFIFNYQTVLIMVIPPLIAYAIALIIPIRKANKIKPIDVMNRE